MKARPEDVYRALATIDGLSGWWTTTTSGESAPGKKLEFRFDQHVVGMRVEALEAGKRVEWQCVDDGTPDWLGTRVTFELSEEAGRTTLVFGHRAWREANPFFAHCSMKWATFLLSLRDYAEKGEGKPFPRDIPV
ncbi:MAG TPA: SRPBCC domain-containing protein [Polyangiaceae bacterium]